MAVTKADTIARHVTQAATHIKTALELSHEPGGDVGGCVDAAARCINAAFLEALGGAAVAGEAVPEPPKPAGWVLPVDAAGNVIEAEDIGATLRREECERKAARQAGEEREWEAMRADLDAALTERADLRIALRAVEAERDKLTTDEADLRHALRQIAGMVGVAVALGASTEMHCAVADEVRLVVERLRHAADGMRKLADDMSTRCDAAETDVARLTKERDAIAAEVQRSREQKPVRWATVRADGTVAESCWFTEEQAMRDARDYGPTYRVAPLYLAPVVRDHSEVIAQCEEALRESSGLVIATDVMRPALRAALSALRGAS